MENQTGKNMEHGMEAGAIRVWGYICFLGTDPVYLGSCRDHMGFYVVQGRGWCGLRGLISSGEWIGGCLPL